VDGVTFSIQRGEAFGLVGESGCGKSTLCRAVAGLESEVQGVVYLEGRNLLNLRGKERKAIAREVQMIFQDPKASLHPLMRIEEALMEPFAIHNLGQPAERSKMVEELLERVGLRPEHKHRLPRGLSGGQRQLVCIARAIALKPKLILCDEPVSSLDVSMQSQVLNLLQDLQEDLGLSYLFVSHNLGIVDYLCKTISVMYLGKIVEIAPNRDLVKRPLHPYTQALLSSIPSISKGRKSQTRPPQGEIPSADKPPSGCRFHPRCLYAMERCQREPPSLLTIETHRQVACHLYP